jgi:hypothetical protein
LIIDANAVLALPVAAQYFESVPRQCRKITNRRSSLHTIKLEARGTFKA